MVFTDQNRNNDIDIWLLRICFVLENCRVLAKMWTWWFMLDYKAKGYMGRIDKLWLIFLNRMIRKGISNKCNFIYLVLHKLNDMIQELEKGVDPDQLKVT